VEDLITVFPTNGFPTGSTHGEVTSDSEVILALTSTPQSCLVFFAAVTDLLLPAVCKLIAHPDGDVRVVVASVLRRMLPNVLKGVRVTHSPHPHLSLLTLPPFE
jgi:hypothetical protein